MAFPEVKLSPHLLLPVFQEVREVTRKIQELGKNVIEKFEMELVLRIEKNPSLLHSENFSELMKSHLELSPEEEKLAREALNEFAMLQWDATIGEKTQQFLINELLYIVLKMKQEDRLWDLEKK